jgi:hypothetical protein
MKIKDQILFLCFFMGITLTGCSPILPVAIDEEIDYTQEITLT